MDENIPIPSSLEWDVEIEKIGHGDTIHCVIKGENPKTGEVNVYGFLRLPSEEYVRYFREKLVKLKNLEK